MFSGAPARRRSRRWRATARRSAIAFQLSDDLIDIASESTQSGKTPGTDLREGVPTLPVLYALASDDADPDSVRLPRDPGRRRGHRRRRACRGAAPASRVDARSSRRARRSGPTPRRRAPQLAASARRLAAPGSRIALRLHRRPHELDRPSTARTSARPNWSACPWPDRRTGDLGSSVRAQRAPIGRWQTCRYFIW